MQVIRCDWCGGTYSVEREWCPHCLAPRVHEQKVHKQKSYDGPRYETAIFYADNKAYMEIRRVT